ncbi:MAG: hypothetical protein EXX96DRAFT_383978 [Benjaminiella poitrasii]|nr:MAG: hypothetical protein EXX96DRAFT_383978 [Benjaminiella poitrasii]
MSDSGTGNNGILNIPIIPLITSGQSPIESATTTAYPPSSTTTSDTTSVTSNPVTTTTSNSDPSGVTTPPPITTNDPPYTSTSPTRPPSSTSITTITTATKAPTTTTTYTSPTMITTTKNIITSTPVPIVTVTSSGTAVYTYTSTSYRSYETAITTTVPSDSISPDTNDHTAATGAIVGGAVGGAAFIVLIGFLVVILHKRRKKNKYNGRTASMDDEGLDPNDFIIDYNHHTDNSHSFSNINRPLTLLSDNSSPTSRPLSMTTNTLQHGAVITKTKPRPLVQAYNPTTADDEASTKHQQGSYYNLGTATSGYSYDAYYQQQHEPMLPVSSSINNLGRNVPDENDYHLGIVLSRKISRHVPDEVISEPSSSTSNNNGNNVTSTTTNNNK